MKFSKKLYTLFAAAFTLSTVLFYGCQKELSDTFVGFPVAPTQKLVNTTVQGQVFDENGAPLAGAQVSAGVSSTTTDKFGIFRFNNVSINQNGGLVKVTKAGYFTGSRSLFYSETSTNFVRVQLIPKKLVGTIDATTGGTAAVATGGVTLPANGVVKAASNQAFTGSINVYAAYLNPTDPNVQMQMPGNLFGVQSNNTLASLETYGMMAVELESAAGEKLQIATGSEATLNFPASASAPATIPLWYFDENTGFWKEEGTATKNGSQYVGKVKHFSFWNCDAPFPLVDFEAKIVDQHGNPLVHKSVVITRSGGNQTSGYGMTDSTGKVFGKIPKNEALVLTVKGECGQVIHTQNIGPFATSTNLGTITASVNASTWVEVTGKVLDCSAASVTNGFVTISVGNAVYRGYPDNTGNFKIRFINCSGATTGTLIAYDYAGLQEGAPVTITLAATVAAGNVTACGTVIQTSFINYSIDGNNFSLTAPPDSLGAYLLNATQGTTVSGFKLQGTNNQFINFRFMNTTSAPGSYPLVSYNSNGIDSARITTPIPVTVTAYGNSGQFIEGNFTGTVLDRANANRVLTVSFKVKRN